MTLATAPFETADQAKDYLTQAGKTPEGDLDIGECALALAAIKLPGISIDRYRQHFKKISDAAQTDFDARIARHEPDDAYTRSNALVNAIHTTMEYAGDEKNYNDLDNANIMRVIDRRRGLPVALGILYIITGHALGWDVSGLNFPGHFVLRVQHGGQRLILDPFRGGKILEAADLRQILKSIVGKNAELSHMYYEPVPARDVLIRLENNLKTRLIEGEDYQGALASVEAISLLSPAEYRTLLEEGILCARLGFKDRALRAIEKYITRVPDKREKAQAERLLQQIKAENPK